MWFNKGGSENPTDDLNSIRDLHRMSSNADLDWFSTYVRDDDPDLATPSTDQCLL
jgi:hypothetical protein